jgi:hypothetical protein
VVKASFEKLLALAIVPAKNLEFSPNFAHLDQPQHVCIRLGAIFALATSPVHEDFHDPHVGSGSPMYITAGNTGVTQKIITR